MKQLPQMICDGVGAVSWNPISNRQAYLTGFRNESAARQDEIVTG